MQPKTIDYSPGIRSFIPLLYVAWADGLLSPSEVKLIDEQINRLDELNQDEKQILREWINPADWPDAQVFKIWVQLMRESAKQAETEVLQSIAALGRVMAERAAIEGRSSWHGGKTYQALKFLEEELGVPGVLKFRAIQPESSDSIGRPVANARVIQDWLDGPATDVKERIKKVLSDPVFNYEEHISKEGYRERALLWLKLLGEQGYGSLGFPQAYGGKNDIMEYASVFEVLSYHDLSLAVKFGVQFGLFGGSIFNLGTKIHHEKYLRKVGTVELPGCFAMTETGHGSNVRDLETTGIYDPDTGEIEVHSPTYSAGKEYIGNALHGKMATVFLQLIVQGENHGVHAVLVPLRNDNGEVLPGIRVEDSGRKLGLNGVDNGRIWFEHVRVPRENLLNRFGQITLLGRYESEIPNPSKRFFTMLGTLVAGRLCVAMGALSAAKSAITIAVRYALTRRQFKPDNKSVETLIMDYPTHQKRLMPRLAVAMALHIALSDLIQVYSQKGRQNNRDIEAMAAGLKARSTWFATDAIQECREACGGKGYLWKNRLADLKADSDIFTTFEGDNTVLLQLVAKSLLSNFKEDFNDAGIFGIIRYLGTRVSDRILQLNPVYKRKTDADHLRDPRFHMHAAAYRERKLLHTLGSRIRQMFRKRITPYDVFLRTQNHMIILAKAYVDRLILEKFQSKLNSLKDPVSRKAMEKVYQLFALHQISTHHDWYLEQDYFEGVKTKAIRRHVERLCSDVRQDASILVSSFGIPDGLLSAPIAFGKM